MTNLSVLVVEDDRLDQKAFTRCVAQANLPYDYQIAASVQQGRLLLKGHDFDVVLVDYHLPDGTGFDILDAVPRHTAVIFVTGAGSEATAIKALRAGANDYLIKDVERIYLDFLPHTVERAVQQKRTDRELRTLSQAVMSSSDSIFVTDLHDNVTHVNHAFCQTYAYAAEEIIGRSSHCLQGDDATDAHSKKESALEACHLRSDGSLFPVTVSRTLVEDDEGTPFAYVSVVRDFTQLKALIAERDELIEQLESFARTVAHDLKSPASLVCSYARFLTDEAASLSADEVGQGLACMERTAERMTETIDALLLLAGTRGVDAVIVEALDMSALVQEALSRIEHLCVEYDAEIVVESPLPMALGYAPWVVELLLNYMSNALKYGGRPPQVTIGAEVTAGQMARFWVRDNGQGLTPDEQAQLYRPFQRLHNTVVDGHGLGLSIVRQIAERLGGSADVRSEVGVGSEFSFTLPAIPVALANARNVDSPRAAQRESLAAPAGHALPTLGQRP